MKAIGHAIVFCQLQTIFNRITTSFQMGFTPWLLLFHMMKQLGQTFKNNQSQTSNESYEI